MYFYTTSVGLIVAAVSVVSIPALPLSPFIYLSQVVDAALLPLHVVALILLARDRAILGAARPGPWMLAAAWVSLTLILSCVGALAWSWINSDL